MTRHPLILVPGIQGRWEWMYPTVAALDAAEWDVRTFSLQDVRETPYFRHWLARIDALIDETGTDRVPLVGVSFGGVVAAAYTARRPDRVSHLVLVSAPAPHWRLDPRSARYARRPILSSPLFAARAVSRLGPEIMTALPSWRARAAFVTRYFGRTLRWPASPKYMSRWVQEWQAADLAATCGGITTPTLLVTGEPSLDRVVPVASSLEYLALIPGARHVTLPRTGHIGLVLHPDEFARIVTAFVK